MKQRRISILVISGCLLCLALITVSTRSQAKPEAQQNVPKLWDAKQLATWATPIAGLGIQPTYYTEEEYYSAPVDNVRTYPVYAPDKEPKGYRDWILKQGYQRLIEPEKLKTEADLVAAGRVVFEGLDLPVTRTDNPGLFALLADEDALRKTGQTITADGIVPSVRWVVDRNGKLELSLSDCAACHTRIMPDGSLLLGAQGNLQGSAQLAGTLAEGFLRDSARRGMNFNDVEYASFGVPWIKDDIHAKLKTMTPDEIFAVDGFPQTGTFARFNGSPYFMTKIPDLIGIRNRRYIDHTGTHLNRGPEDIARYAILVSVADDGAIGSYKFYTAAQRRLEFRFCDEALYAIGKFVYSLEPPANPNKLDSLAERGQKVFTREGCSMCHTPPLYTNNTLIPVDGFTPPKDDPATQRLHILRGVSVGTDPNLALRTRKGTGYYKVPSLRGLWYRSLIEHSGSIASLEEWFDRKRLRDDYVPSGWQAPGIKTRAVKGHEFGLDLSADDKRALIAFLKTL